MSLETFLLFIAGFVGGILNSIAGGGTFITFPALLLAGVPPISANATNTFASCSGYLSGAYALRKEILAHKKELPRLIMISLIGGMAGAWLLLQTPAAVFQQVIPWLLLFAMVVFIYGERCNRWLTQLTAHYQHASSVGRFLLLLTLLGVCTYGGFFNAGLGIITLSYLALAGYRDINAMNGLKLLISSAVSLMAIVLFINDDVIAWQEGMAVLVGTFTGGYIAAHISRTIPQKYSRTLVILIGSGITLHFFYTVY
mgnify:CR=1 FL=1